MFCSKPFLAQDQKHEFVLKLAANTEGARERSFVVSWIMHVGFIFIRPAVHYYSR